MKKLPFNPILMAVIILGVVLLGLVYFILRQDGITETQGANGAPVVTTGQAKIGGAFTLVDQNGKTVTEKDFLGRYTLIYFGFTFCPVICPTELQAIAGAMDALGAKADKVQPVFISIDPERDTPAVLAPYVKLFHPRLIGLTGTPEQVAVAAHAYKVYYAKVEDEGSSGGYTMDHSSVVYLMGPDGKFVSFFPPGTTPDKMAAKIADAIDGK